MARGTTAAVGAERIAPNRYTYVKTEDRGWVLKHWLIWEEVNGRQVDSAKEQIRFKDGNRTNFDSENLVCILKGKVQLRAKIARLEVAKTEIEAQLKYYYRQLEAQESKLARS